MLGNVRIIFTVSNMWKFAFLLLLAHGAFCLFPAGHWVLETIRCSDYRIVLEPDRNFVETPEALDYLCNQQAKFYFCLDNLLKYQHPSNMKAVVAELEDEMRLFNGLCTEGRIWRNRYLAYGPCMNMQNTDFCTTPELAYVEGRDDAEGRCTKAEKITNCMAATFAMKCGIEAGYLFHHILKVQRRDECLARTITPQDSEARSDRKNSEEIVLDEAYHKLVKKIGQISNQDETESFLQKRVGEMLEETWEIEY